MKLVLTTALAVGLACSAFAQEAAPDPESIKKAEELIGQVSKVYKDSKAITDSVILNFQTPMGAQTQEMKVTIGAGDDAVLELTGMTMTAVGGKLYLQRDDVKDKYFVAPLDGGLKNTLQSVFGDGFPLPPQFTLRTDASTEDKLLSLTLGVLKQPKLTGHRTMKTDDGVTMHEVSFTAESGKGTMQVSEAKLVRQIQLEFTPQGAPPGMTINATINMSPKLLDALDTPIAYNAGTRKAVESLDELEPTPVKVGQISPDFTLSTLGGESVTLSKLHGSVVVLDFWATWCGPCKRGLPLLQEFATWAETSGQSVKVYAVNVIERTKDAAERKTKVQEFWTSAKYTIPTLIDVDNTVFPDYGFSGIPATVVIGPDGKIFSIHDGFSPDMVDALKKDVTEAAKVSG